MTNSYIIGDDVFELDAFKAVRNRERPVLWAALDEGPDVDDVGVREVALLGVYDDMAAVVYDGAVEIIPVELLSTTREGAWMAATASRIQMVKAAQNAVAMFRERVKEVA